MSKVAENQTAMDLSKIFAASSQGPSVWKRIHAYRDKGTHADEFLRLFKWVLLPISVLITSLFQFALVFFLALPLLGAFGAFLSALLFCVFIEGAKIWLGIMVWRGLIFGNIRLGVASAMMVITGAVLCVCAFFWSYSNSTEGIHYVTDYVGHYKVARDTTKLGSSTIGIDSIIAATAGTTKQALNTKYKGVVTYHAQKTALNQSKIQLEQEKQRTALLQAELANKGAESKRRDTFIDRIGGFLSMMGGKMEWFQLFLIIPGLILCERTLFDRMKSSGQTGHPEPAQQTSSNGTTPAVTSYKSTANGYPQNIQSRAPIGFNKDESGNVRSAYTPQGVSHQPQGVSHRTDSSFADDVLENACTNCRRYFANFDDGKHSNKTTSTRINETIDSVYSKMNGPGFTPSPTVGLKAYDYFCDLLVSLDRKGWPYENSIIFARKLLDINLRVKNQVA